MAGTQQQPKPKQLPQGAQGAKQPAPAPASSHAGPVLLALHKRLRATRKKLRYVDELEALRAGGKELSPEQVPGGRWLPRCCCCCCRAAACRTRQPAW